MYFIPYYYGYKVELDDPVLYMKQRSDLIYYSTDSRAFYMIYYLLGRHQYYLYMQDPVNGMK